MQALHWLFPALERKNELGKIYVVGLGPGALDCMSERAKAAIMKADTIAGYSTYIDLAKPLIRQDQLIIQSGMRGEVERCQEAMEAAIEGQIVAMICSGDAGIYGMASLLFELSEAHQDVDIEVVAGITAASSGAAILGAPIADDFCVISLSDLLTPQELIDRRIQACAMADFICAIYNPMSKRRQDKLSNLCKVFLQYRPLDTVCGWVRQIERLDQSYKLCTLQELQNEQVDMFTTVFIGNSNTTIINGKMVTRRGYHTKYQW